MVRARALPLLLVALAVASCNKPKPLPPQADVGPNPVLVAPHYNLLAPIRVAPVIGWGAKQAPVAARGLSVTRFADGLNHPRWLYVLPDGDVLVAETDGPAEIVKRPKDIIMGLFMSAAGSHVLQHHRILLLRDADGDGRAETRSVFLDNLRSPFGMALIGADFYVANTDALLRFPYREGGLAIAGKGTKVIDLPAGPINHHWTKSLIASQDGSKLYVTVGSNSNVSENGMEQEAGRAAIWEVDPRAGRSRIFASGMRNANGMGWEPRAGTLWAVANERDEIGDDLVPDYITAVREGGFYGWPYSYYGQHVDARAHPKRPDLVNRAIKPDYAIGSHMGSLGFVFSDDTALSPAYRDGAFVGQHGSWNRSQPSGYRVIYVPFSAGRPNGVPRVVLSGFLDGRGNARGRPVGVAIDKRGGLLVADDAGNSVWRVTALKPA